MKYRYYNSPIGRLLIAGKNGVLHYLSFPNGRMNREPEHSWEEDKEVFPEAIQQLTEYFEGERDCFDLKLHFQGTCFQEEVWCALQQIPYGETVSYSELAKRIGRARASQAVGSANAANPLPIIIPCHRVISKSGALSGFGGGVETKIFLLKLEGSWI